MTDGLKILIADDNEDLLETFAMILTRHGFSVETARNGLSAVEQYRRRRYDVALMDIVMPGLNGVEASRKIKAIDPQAVIILMTGHSDEALLRLARDEGARHVVNKPVKIDQLIELIAEAAGDQPLLVIDSEDADICDGTETTTVVKLKAEDRQHVR
jgi:two-component system chemotaxis response regulator CheY